MDVNGEDDPWTDDEDYGFRSPIEKGLSLIANIFTGLVKVAKVIITPVFYLVGGILFFSLLSTWLGLTVGAVFILPHMDFFTYGPNALGYVGLFNAVFALGIPLLVIVLGITKHIFKFKVNKTITVSLIVFAVINFFSLASIGGNTLKDLKVETTQVSQYDGQVPDSDTIHLHFQRARDLDDNFVIDLGDAVKISNDELIVEAVDFNIRRTDSKAYSIDFKKEGRGNNSVAAEEYLNQMDLDIRTKGNHLYIPEYYSIAKGGKFRGQHMEVTLNVPEGKYIVFDKKARNNNIHNVDIAEGYKRTFSKKDAVWQMTENGLVNNLTEEAKDSKEPHKVTISLSATEGLDINVESDNE